MKDIEYIDLDIPESDVKKTEANRVERRSPNRRRKKKRGHAGYVILSLLLITSVTVGSLYAYLYYAEKKDLEKAILDAEQATEDYEELLSELENDGYIPKDEVDEMISNNTVSIKDMIRSSLENGDGVLMMLENLYDDMIVVPNYGRYNFFNIDSTLKASEIDKSKLIYPVKNEDTGKYEGEALYDDGNVKAKKVIDVSKFQGDIDWQRVKDDGVEAAYIRLGYRGYSSGEIVVDEKYEDNISACNELGIDCGVYFFTEAVNEEEAREEADFCIENLGEYSTALPIAIDVEESANLSKSRTKDLSMEQRTLNVIAFCERIREKGYEPIIYGNLKSLMIMMDISSLEDYDKWFAYYHYPLRFPYKIKMWQYSATRKVDGIEGDVDLNLMFY
ncbi:MAG: glycoside hydrolase family 25 protein [Lachnospiraceae bacterium]|nr:glycoside hydrolase family 25 protein [Lachnospiraceae bacterium]